MTAVSTSRTRAGLLVGHAATLLGRALRSLPGVAGALLVSFGVYEIYAPAGFIAAGVLLLVLDRQT